MDPDDTTDRDPRTTVTIPEKDGIQPIVTLIPSSDGDTPTLYRITVDTETMEVDIDAETPGDSEVMVDL